MIQKIPKRCGVIQLSICRPGGYVTSQPTTWSIESPCQWDAYSTLFPRSFSNLFFEHVTMQIYEAKDVLDDRSSTSWESTNQMPTDYTSSVAVKYSQSCEVEVYQFQQRSTHAKYMVKETLVISNTESVQIFPCLHGCGRAALKSSKDQLERIAVNLNATLL